MNSAPLTECPNLVVDPSDLDAVAIALLEVVAHDLLVLGQAIPDEPLQPSGRTARAARREASSRSRDTRPP